MSDTDDAIDRIIGGLRFLREKAAREVRLLDETIELFESKRVIEPLKLEDILRLPVREITRTESKGDSTIIEVPPEEKKAVILEVDLVRDVPKQGRRTEIMKRKVACILLDGLLTGRELSEALDYPYSSIQDMLSRNRTVFAPSRTGHAWELTETGRKWISRYMVPVSEKENVNLA